MFWSGETFVARGQTVISDFDPKQIDVNSYPIKMGDQYFRTADKEGTSTSPAKLKPGETFSIPAGQFAYLLSKEVVSIPPDTMGFISMRTGLKFQGLINVSGFHVDPGYKGRLLFAVYNAGALASYLSEGEAVYKLWLAKLDRDDTEMLFDNKKSISKISNDLVRGMSREILSLQSLSERMRALERSVEVRLEAQKPVIDNLTLVFRTIVVGAVGAAFIALFSFSDVKQTAAEFASEVRRIWMSTVKPSMNRIP